MDTTTKGRTMDDVQELIADAKAVRRLSEKIGAAAVDAEGKMRDDLRCVALRLADAAGALELTLEAAGAVVVVDGDPGTIGPAADSWRYEGQ
jgi:hypothetical protein